MSERDGDESALFPERPGRRRRPLTRRVVRGINRLSELPLPLTVGVLLAIGLALSFVYMHFCL